MPLRPIHTPARAGFPRLVALVAAGLVAGLLASPVHAGGDYVFNSPYLPDLDQRRLIVLPCDLSEGGTLAGVLPNTGDMYCVPTSAVNWMALISEFGFPELMPGSPANWQGAAAYCDATAAIDEMGMRMATDAQDGTGFDGSKNGLQEWLDDRAGPGLFVVERARAQGNYAPTLSEIALAGHLGYYLNLNVGWYEEVPIVGGTGWVRDGGHEVTLTGALRNMFLQFDGNGSEVRYRNPWTAGSDSLATQSAFATTTRTTFWITANFSNGGSNPAPGLRRMAALNNYTTSSGKQGFIHGYLGVIPCQAVLECGPSLKIASPLTNLPGVPPNLIVTLPAPVEEVDFGPTLASLVVQLADPVSGLPASELLLVDPIDGTQSPLAALPAGTPIVDFETAPNTDLYLLGGNALARFGPDSATTPVASLALGALVEEICAGGIYGGASAPVIFAVGDDLAGSLTFATYDLDLTTETLLPPPAGLGGLPGGRHLAIDPVDGTLWVRGDAADEVHRLTYDPGAPPAAPASLTLAETVTIPGLAGAAGLTIDRAGRLLFTRAGFVEVYSPDPTGGYLLDPTAPFAGEEVGTTIRIRNGRDLSDPGEAGSIADINLVPVADDPLLESFDCPPGSSTEDCNGNRIPDGCDIADGTSLDLDGNGIPDECAPVASFVRGRCNDDASFDIADAIFLLDFLFAGGATPNCRDACDLNDDGGNDIADAISILGVLFSGAPSPVAPFPDCGADPTADTLDCPSGAGC